MSKPTPLSILVADVTVDPTNEVAFSETIPQNYGERWIQYKQEYRGLVWPEIFAPAQFTDIVAYAGIQQLRPLNYFKS